MFTSEISVISERSFKKKTTFTPRVFAEKSTVHLEIYGYTPVAVGIPNAITGGYTFYICALPAYFN
jgi:hypothetical protein